MCNHHKTDLENPDTEWMLDRDTRQLYVGDSLRDLNEYILVDPPSQIVGYGTRESSATKATPACISHFRVRRRGDLATNMVLVLPSKLSDAFKHVGEMLPR